MSGGLNGMTAWLVQRISAVYLALYMLGFLLALLISGGWNHAEWQALMTSRFMVATTFLFYISLLLHAWVGMRDVVMDYIHPLPIRLTVLAMIGATLLLFAFWSLAILIGIL